MHSAQLLRTAVFQSVKRSRQRTERRRPNGWDIGKLPWLSYPTRRENARGEIGRFSTVFGRNSRTPL